MLKRLRRHLNPPTVIATIALFAALGGGYALAFSGSGSLQKAGVDGLPTTFTDVRTLTGFGKLQARCDTTDQTTELRFHNSTDDDVAAHGEITTGANPDFNLSAFAGADSNVLELGTPAITGTARFHVFKPGANSKAQIDLTISAVGPPVGFCINSQLRILALNTQQP